MTTRHVEILEAASTALRDARGLAMAILTNVLDRSDERRVASALAKLVNETLSRIDKRIAKPIEGRADLERAEIAAQRIARIVDDETPPGYGFILWIASYGEAGVGTYVATIKRDDAIRMLQEWIALQQGANMPPTLDGVDMVAPECWCCGDRGDRGAVLITVKGPNRSVDVCAACVTRSTEP